MPTSAAIDGFHLAYDTTGEGPPVVLLHGWPGDRTDYRALVPLLAADRQVVVPDLRGFGESDKPPGEPPEAYSASAQARSVAGLIAELGLSRPVVAGYDIGSGIAQALTRADPELVGALVLAPPLPGIGERILGEVPLKEFWYQQLHRLPLALELIDGKPDAVRAYLRHFWTHWSGPGFEPDEAELDHLVSVYGAPGAFTASIGWYRAGAGTVERALNARTPDPADRIHVPTTVLWPEHDPLFPREWSDRIGDFFSAAELHDLGGAGHFSPLEAPREFADAVLRAGA